MTQTSLFPVKLVHEEATGGTRDLRLVGYCANQVKYAVKRESDGPMLPLAEWIGHKLSAFCGIPTPEFDIVVCMDGELAFGSRWDSSATQIKVFDSAAHELLSTHSSAISKIFGLDFFLPNPDRHLGNFLFLPNATPGCLSFDFSLSSVRNGLPFGSHPMAPNVKTNLILREFLIKKLNKFDKHRYNDALIAVQGVSSLQIESILNAAPVQWFTKVSKEQIVEWWESSKGTRIKQVVK